LWAIAQPASQEAAYAVAVSRTKNFATLFLGKDASMGQIGLIRALLFVASSATATPQSVAGSCDCRPEISNANAITVGSCAKLWSNNQCTLKEDGSSGGSGSIYNDLQSKVRLHVTISDAPKKTLAIGQFDKVEFGSAIAALTNPQNVDFVASVLNLYDDNLQTIAKHWGIDTPTIFKSTSTTAVISNKCFYAQDITGKFNFYLNFNEDNRPCEAWGAVK
jgi:hypothetical protein